MQNQTEPNRVKLSKDQAISMLSDSESIHTFRSGSMALIGADWDRIDIIEAIHESECEIGGEACKRMNHGLVVHTGGFPLFVQCKEGFDYEAFESTIAVDENRERWAMLVEMLHKQYNKQDRDDKSLDWNLGFNDCCKFFIEFAQSFEAAAT